MPDQQHAVGLLRQALQAIEQAGRAGEIERVLEDELRLAVEGGLDLVEGFPRPERR
jgi:hypothetical protein